MKIEKLSDGRLSIPVHLSDGNLRADGFMTIGPEHELYNEYTARLKSIGTYSRKNKPDPLTLCYMKLDELRSLGTKKQFDELMAIAEDFPALETYFADVLSLYTDDDIEPAPTIGIQTGAQMSDPTSKKTKVTLKPKKGRKPNRN